MCTGPGRSSVPVVASGCRPADGRLARTGGTMLADHAAMPVLAVTDLDRARAFYEGTLGFSSGPEVPEGVLYRTSNGGFLVYPSAYAGTNKATAISIQLSADAFDTEVAALRTAGI